MTADESIDMLRNIMGDEFDLDLARKALAKHNGSLQAAASALLDKENFDEPEDEPIPSYSHSERRSRESEAVFMRKHMNTPVAGVSMNSLKVVDVKDDKERVIDLTDEQDEDPDYKRALQMSMETVESTQEPTLKPSDRAPDNNWAVVPVHMPTPTTISNEEQSLAQAIEASLSTSIAEDKYEDLEGEQQIRMDKRPIALRAKDQSACYAALLWHALFFIPQIRSRIAEYMGIGVVETPSELNIEAFVPFTLKQLFAQMDCAVLTSLVVECLPESFRPTNQPNSPDGPGKLTNELYCWAAKILETSFRNSSQSPNQDQLWFMTRVRAPSRASFEREIASVPVTIRSSEDPNSPNDLISRLSALLGITDEGEYNIGTTCLLKPSEVISFTLIRQQDRTEPQGFIGPQIKQAKEDPLPFRFPKRFFLDQFLIENATFAAEKRADRKRMRKEIEMLTAKREELTKFNGEDVLKNLNGSLYYYEKVASKDEGPERKEHVKVMTAKLRKIITKVNVELKALDETIAVLKDEVETVFDGPSWKQHQYTLRAVLVHDGLFGRNHLYSYVLDRNTWWKMLDFQVMEVSEETVLTDGTGLHLGAGPYMLLYSRAISEESGPSNIQWPTRIVENCRLENEEVLNTNGFSPDFIDRVRQVHGLAVPQPPGEVNDAASSVDANIDNPSTPNGIHEDVVMDLTDID